MDNQTQQPPSAPTQDLASPPQSTPPSSETPASEQPTLSEQAPAPSPASPPPPDLSAELAKRDAELARNAYARRQAENQLKAAEARLAALEKEKESAFSKLSEFEQLDKVDELSVVTEMARRRGLSPEDYVRRVVSRMAHGKPAVEDEIADVRTAAKRAEERAAKLEQQLIDQEKAREAERAAAETQAYIDDYAATAADAISETKFPILSGLDPDEVVNRVLTIADQYAGRTGVVPPAEAVLDYLEKEENARLEKLASRAGFSRAQAAPQAPAGQRPQPITGQMAAERGGTPIDWAALPERERVRLAGREVFGERK